MVRHVDESRGPATSLRREPVAYLTQTTLARGRDLGDDDGTWSERFAGLRGPGVRRHLLRQPEPSDRGQGGGRAVPAGARHRGHQLLQLRALVEVARDAGTPAHLVPGPDDLDESWLAGVDSVGVSAGASAPGTLVDGLLRRLAALGYSTVEVERTTTEDIVFGLPSQLKGTA